MGNKTPNFKAGLKRARKRAGYKTQEEFANGIKKSIETVRNWEQGKTKPSLDDFIQLCEDLSCDADYLLDNLDEQTHDIDFICKYTGLSSDAVNYLQVMNDREQQFSLLKSRPLDFFITNCWRFLLSMEAISRQCQEAESILNSGGAPTEEQINRLFDLEKDIKYSQMELWEESRNIVDKAYNVRKTQAEIENAINKYNKRWEWKNG